ncbi:hypothetical protein [Peterkaempfera griseoplana]|uniref:hypothetical protein n=1 Tax=Peterkaempfera griseoplana TaxID=66896 RepID=UPI0006E31B1D|nr:hypothetical protein [Peterkaempfera griseoplana]
MPVSRATRAATAARRARLVDMRRQKRPYKEICEELGYASVNAARRDFSRALEESIAAQHTNVEVYREEQLVELEYLAEEVHAVFRADHFMVSASGRIVTHPVTGEPLRDPQPRMAAADRLLKIASEVSKLRGLHAPSRVEGVFTIDALNDALEQAREQLAALEAEDPEDGGAEGPPS